MDLLSDNGSITDIATTTTTTESNGGSGSSSTTQKHFYKLDRVGVALINGDNEVEEYKDARIVSYNKTRKTYTVYLYDEKKEYEGIKSNQLIKKIKYGRKRKDREKKATDREAVTLNTLRKELSYLTKTKVDGDSQERTIFEKELDEYNRFYEEEQTKQYRAKHGEDPRGGGIKNCVLIKNVRTKMPQHPNFFRLTRLVEEYILDEELREKKRRRLEQVQATFKARFKKKYCRDYPTDEPVDQLHDFIYNNCKIVEDKVIDESNLKDDDKKNLKKMVEVFRSNLLWLDGEAENDTGVICDNYESEPEEEESQVTFKQQVDRLLDQVDFETDTVEKDVEKQLFELIQNHLQKDDKFKMHYEVEDGKQITLKSPLFITVLTGITRQKAKRAKKFRYWVNLAIYDTKNKLITRWSKCKVYDLLKFIIYGANGNVKLLTENEES